MQVKKGVLFSTPIQPPLGGYLFSDDDLGFSGHFVGIKTLWCQK
jgi:hypothetical protein